MIINTTNNPIKQIKSVIEQQQNISELPFSKVFSPESIVDKLNTINYRERIFTPDLTLFGFLSQAIGADKSHQAAVSQVIAYLVSNGQKAPSVNTSAYSQAKDRLPIELLSCSAQEVAKDLEKEIPSEWMWRNRHIKIADGTTVSMPDTPANQLAFPQHTTQKPGVGFPIMRIVGVSSLATGAIIDCAISPCSGEGTGEPTLLIRQLLSNFNKGDIFLADACYCTYFLIALLINKGVDVVFPQLGARNTDFRLGNRLGKKDHLVQWTKPEKPKWMDKQEYDSFPNNITVRETSITCHRPGYRDKSRVLVTTLICNKTIKPHDLNELYNYRWYVEIDFCSIKEVMKMDILRSKTPEMVRKEVWAHFLAYNLIRKIMAQSAVLNSTKPREMSFKLTLQMLCSFRQAGLLCKGNNQIYIDFLRAIAYKTVGNRPGRSEPRRVKRRPKSVDYLVWPRNYYKKKVA